MESSRLVCRTEGEALVAYRQLLLQERGGQDVTVVKLDTDTDDEIAAGGEGGVKLWSAGNDHYPSVRLELWSDTPVRSQEAWELTQEETLSVSATGEVALTTLFGEESDACIALPNLGTYRVRVHVRGRDEAWQRGEAKWFHGVEQWLLQIWPSEVQPT
jgi:hypothetical protein